MKNGQLKIDHNENSVSAYKIVQKIETLDSNLQYKLKDLHFLNGYSFKLNEVNFQPLQNLNFLSAFYYKGVSQTVDLKTFRNSEKLYFINLFSGKINRIENTANECILPNLNNRLYH